MARLRRTACTTLLLLALGCAGAKPPRGEPAALVAKPRRAGAAAPLTKPDATTDKEPPRPGEADDTCFMGVPEPASALEALNEIAERCAAGMQPVIPEPLVVALEEEQRRDLPFVVMEAGRCFRVVAAGGAGIEHLRVDVVDREDHALDSSDEDNRVAVVGPKGPFCVDAPGSYRAVARVRAGSGEVALQVYRAR